MLDFTFCDLFKDHLRFQNSESGNGFIYFENTIVIAGIDSLSNDILRKR